MGTLGGLAPPSEKQTNCLFVLQLEHGSGRDQLLERTLGVRLVGMAQFCPTTAPCYPLANNDWGSRGFEGTRPSLRQGRLPPLSLQSRPHGRWYRRGPKRSGGVL